MKVIFEAYAGSKLFGTNGPNSDLDIKGVYLPSAEDILLGQVKVSVKENTNSSNTKNTSADIDKEYFSLAKFFRMLEEGQTVAIEMLFTPEEMVLQTSPEWQLIQVFRKDFLHKGVLAFIGYARQQANKYGLRGSRMGALKAVINVLEKGNKYDQILTLKEALEAEATDHDGQIRFVELPVNKNMMNQTELHLDVIGRKFGMTNKIGYTLEILQKLYDGYGERSRQAEKNEGIDWKALSHAVRVINQGKELLSTGELILPRPDAVLLKAIKYGETEFKVVQKLIEDGIKELEESQLTSALPDKLDHEWINSLICTHYAEIVKEER